MSKADDRGSPEQDRAVDARVLLHPGPLAANEAALSTALEQLVGGKVSEWERAERNPRFMWRGVSRAALMLLAETGQLDAALTKSGAPAVLLIEANADHERLYEWVPEVEFREPRTQDIDRKSTELLLRDTDLLLLTVTPIERRAVLAHLWPLPGAEAVQTGSLDLVTYRFGQFGRYRAAHVQCTMGSGGTRGSTLTAHDAIQGARPKATLVLGIAFGASRQKFHLGDVLVAEQIASYELAKLTPDDEIHRGLHHTAGVHLAERFANRRDDWHFPRGYGEVDVHQGLVLSGEKVIDRRTFRDALLREYPTAIGGEMEGSGAYAAAERHRTQILLLKGICDWADGHKNDRAQAFAAAASTSLAEHVLSKPDVLADLGAQDCGLRPRVTLPVVVRSAAPPAAVPEQATEEDRAHGDRYFLWLAVLRASQLISSRLAGTPGPSELRLEQEFVAGWDEVLEVWTEQGSRQQHRWLVKRQAPPLASQSMQVLLKSVAYTRNAAMAHVVFREWAPIDRAGSLGRLRDLCLRARSPATAAPPRFQELSSDESQWVEFIRMALDGGSDGDVLSVLQRLDILPPRSEMSLREEAEKGIQVFFQSPEALCLQLHSLLESYSGARIQITYAQLDEKVLKGFPPTATPRKSASQESEEVQAYLEAVKEYCSNLPYLSLHEIRPKKSLPEVYVDLRAYEADQENTQKGTAELRKLVRLSIAEMVQDSASAPIVVVGEPGSGKSTLLRYMAERAWSSPTSIGLPRPHLPLLLSLPLLASMNGTLETRLRRVLNESLPLRQDLPEGFMSSWEQEVSAPWLLLLDALDEVPIAQRAQHLQWLSGTLKRFSNVRILVTTRPTGYQRGDISLEGLKHYEILPFDSAQIAEFAHRWFSDKASAFLREFASVRVVDHESTPLLLTIAAKVFLERGFLPVSRSGLYAEMVNILLSEAGQRGLEAELGKPVSDVASFALSQLALAMTKSASADVPQLLENYLQQACSFSPDQARAASTRFLKSMSRRSGILVPRMKSVGFIHPTFQEYLAAEGILAECEKSLETLWARCISNWAHRQWREVALFCLGLLSDRGVNVAPLLERIWRIPIPSDDDEYRLQQVCEAFEFVGTAIADGVRLEAQELDAVARRLLRVARKVEKSFFGVLIEPDPVRSLGLLRGSGAAVEALRTLFRDTQRGPWACLRALKELTRLAPLAQADLQLLLSWGTGTEEDAGFTGYELDWGEFRIEIGLYFANMSQTAPATYVFSSIAMDLQLDTVHRLDAFYELLKTASDAELLCDVLRQLLMSREMVHQPLERLLSDLSELSVRGVPDVLFEVACRRVNPWKRCDIAAALADFGETERSIELLDHLSKHLDDSGARDYATRLLGALRQPKA